MRTAAMVRTERRAPRITVKGLAYVNLDRDNGGVILNISEGGLCFKSTAPVQRTEMIRFWFLYGSQRIGGNTGKDEAHTRDATGFIETESELAWTDDARKIGGLRFTNLQAEAHKQICDWIGQASPAKINEKSAPWTPLPHKFPILNVKRLASRNAVSDTNAARGD
jgi:hypothetical protein